MTTTREAQLKAPKTIWAFDDDDGGIPRSGYWIDEKSETPECAIEYTRADLALATPTTEPHGYAEGQLDTSSQAVQRLIDRAERCDDPEMAMMLRALSTPATEPQGYVEGLVWVEAPGSKDVYAKTAHGNYAISVDSAFAGESHYLWVAGQAEDDEVHATFPNMRQAKAAAQAHFNALAARPTPQPAADTRVVVKPLDWQDMRATGGTLAFFAMTIVGRYKVQHTGGADHAFWVAPDGTLTPTPTIELAKNAAQADYEKRIRSALAGQGETP